jgi:hypothetical protein
MRLFQPFFDNFLRNNRCSVTFGKIYHGLYSGFGFHPLGERNTAGGAHVKILNPIKSCAKGCCCDP